MTNKILPATPHFVLLNLLPSSFNISHLQQPQIKLAAWRLKLKAAHKSSSRQLCQCKISSMLELMILSAIFCWCYTKLSLCQLRNQVLNRGHIFSLCYSIWSYVQDFVDFIHFGVRYWGWLFMHARFFRRWNLYYYG